MAGAAREVQPSSAWSYDLRCTIVGVYYQPLSATTFGLYPEQLIQWKQACEQANDWDQASEKRLKEATQSERKKNKQLQKELARKEKALAEAAALLVLRKKYNALFGDHEDES